MSKLALSCAAVLALCTTARADDAPGEEQMVLLNATQRPMGQVDRLRRVLDQRGLLKPLPRTLEAAMDGRSVMLDDVDAIKDAYGEAEFDKALKLIDVDEQRILKAVGG